MVLRRIFGYKREEVAVTGGWRRCNNEHHNLNASPNTIRVIKLRRVRWVGHVSCMGEMRNACRVLVETPEGKRPLRKT
jgi:hypothetical protein